MFKLLPVLTAALLLAPAQATVYHVAQAQPGAADTNPGSAEQPWKTLAHAAAAPLVAGDTVLVHDGVYREEVILTRSGEPGQPITFAAAPGERVVIKGSDVVKGPWQRLTGDPNVKEPYPNAYANVWKVHLGDEFFVGPEYVDKARRYVSSVFQDGAALQQIGPDLIYRNDEYTKITVVGRDLRDIHLNSFFYDNADQTLYVCVAGEPGWYLTEVGTRQWLLTANRLHDVVIRGLTMAQNRQPGGQWPAVSIGESERVTLERCTIAQADFCGLGLGRSRLCVVRDCDLIQNCNTGLGMGECTDCLITDCRLSYNNTRRFHDGWHCGGAKCIPSNRRCTIQRCEAAFNVQAPGIWFDYDNAECRILDNVVHDNGGAGIFYEINKGGGIIAGNLVYANHSRGIYLSGSQNVWVVANTVAGNNCGIVAMPREGDWTLENNRILNNLLLNNTLAGPAGPRGCEITVYMGSDDAGPRTVTSNHSDYNLFASAVGVPTLRQSWNPDNPLDTWQKRYGEDLHSRALPLTFGTVGGRFRLEPSAELVKLAAAMPAPQGVPGWTARAAVTVGAGVVAWPGP
ncbi:MAG: right-handed parallel beta-helix repeat-containing protein [Armatimonadetes bacterium]|nr:right-handed parallel beta-helix repeat-containing protein [Armatimonadota bacterium]